MKSAATPPSRRAVILAITLAVASAGLMLWAYAYMAGERETARASAAEAAECRALAGRIESLRHRSSTMVVAGGAKGELVRRITAAAMTAGFDDDALDRIEPETQRVGGETSGASEQARVYLKKVTLHQAVAFFHDLDTSGSLSVVRLRFVAPAGGKSGVADATADTNRWAVEATLSRGAGSGPRGARATAIP